MLNFRHAIASQRDSTELREIICCSQLRLITFLIDYQKVS